MQRLIILCILSFLVSGCISVTPSFDEALYKHLEALNADLDKIDAAVNNVYTTPPPFNKLEGYYVSASANIDRALAISKGREEYLKGNISGRPAEIISQAIDNCRKAFNIQLSANKLRPLDRKTLEVLAVRDACNIAKLMESRLKG